MENIELMIENNKLLKQLVSCKCTKKQRVKLEIFTSDVGVKINMDAPFLLGFSFGYDWAGIRELNGISFTQGHYQRVLNALVKSEVLTQAATANIDIVSRVPVGTLATARDGVNETFQTPLDTVLNREAQRVGNMSGALSFLPVLYDIVNNVPDNEFNPAQAINCSQGMFGVVLFRLL